MPGKPVWCGIEHAGCSTDRLGVVAVSYTHLAGFISGSQRYNYGKENYKIPQPIIEKRERLREVAGRHGVDLRTAALQFSATPDIASALVVGAASEQQIVADYSSMQVKIPAEFWAELKERKLIEQDAPVPA